MPRRGIKASKSSYGAWADMKQRCNNPNLKNFYLYGGRGIKVCKRWESFDNFYTDMGDKPKDKSLGRIDNSKGYSPDNCRWETNDQQNFNKRSNKILKFQGKSLPVTTWAKLKGLSPITVTTRINRGWPVKHALTLKPFPTGGKR